MSTLVDLISDLPPKSEIVMICYEHDTFPIQKPRDFS